MGRYFYTREEPQSYTTCVILTGVAHAVTLTWAGGGEGEAANGEAGTAGWTMPLSPLSLMLPQLPLRLTLLLSVSLELPGVTHR